MNKLHHAAKHNACHKQFYISLYGAVFRNKGSPCVIHTCIIGKSG